MGKGKGALKVEVFSLGESGVGVIQKGSLAVVEEITAVVQEEEKLVPQERVQQPIATERVQRRTVDAPKPQVWEETVVVVRLGPT